MKILVATHNQSKLARYQKILNSIKDVELISLTDLKITEKVEENFDTNVENAIHKAKIYGELSGLITVAIDEALMTNFLPDNEQPGVYARRFSKDKTELTDSGVIDVWQKIFENYPQDDKQFIWSFAVAYYNPINKSNGVDCVQQISYVAGHFSKKVPNGYPMSAFLSPQNNGIPYSDMDENENHKNDLRNFENFIKSFRQWLTIDSSK